MQHFFLRNVMFPSVLCCMQKSCCSVVQRKSNLFVCKSKKVPGAGRHSSAIPSTGVFRIWGHTVLFTSISTALSRISICI